MKLKKWQIAIIAIAVIAIIAVSAVYILHNTQSKPLVAKEEQTDHHENGWDKNIVAQIQNDNVPVPNGFTYIKGNKDTGLIIQDEKTNTQYLWVPVNKTSEEKDYTQAVNQYFGENNYEQMASDDILSVQAYGGFYIGLKNENGKNYTSVKNMTQEEYEKAKQEINNLYAQNQAVRSHLMTVQDLTSFLAFSNQTTLASKEMMTMSVKLASNNDTIIKENQLNYQVNGTIVTLNNGRCMTETQVPTAWKNTIDKVVDGVPIPKGYTHLDGMFAKTGIAIGKNDSKTSNGVYRLRYVWVPIDTENSSINYLEHAKAKLKEIYDKAGKLSDYFDDYEENLPQELKRSIEQYGGFYMSEAELGFDNDGNLYNRARGMITTSNGMPYVNVGDYFRTIRTGNISQNKTYPSYFADKKLTYNKAKYICEEIMNENNSSVVSHLTYGAEWDAAMVWFVKSFAVEPAVWNEDYQAEYIISDSSSIGKYAGGNNSFSKIRMINGIWGLAGNLAEFTQEKCYGTKYNGAVVARGGSFLQTGNDAPMAVRNYVMFGENIETPKDNIGFRNCLYIKTTAQNEQGSWSTSEDQWSILDNKPNN